METFLIVFALSLDAFVASIAYGTSKINIPFRSMIIIDMVCTSSLAISILLGSLIKRILPQGITTMISFLILIALGIFYLLEGMLKSYVKNNFMPNRKVKFRLFDIWFIISVYMDETKADYNKSRSLNSKEALYLAIALSLDSLAIGFGSSLGSINCMGIISLSLIINMFAIWGGLNLGKQFVKKIKFNLSWLAGVMLIVLAFLRLK